MNTAIELQEVSFSYENNVVLNQLSFSIPEGDYVAVIGPNGAGKTTLLKIILQLIRQTSGNIRIFGKDSDLFKNQGIIGYVPQRSSQSEFNFPATVEEIVTSGRTPRIGVFRDANEHDKEAIRKAMVMTEIDAYKDRLIANLSGGQRQRVFIARALANEPRILILDEPLTGLDSASEAKFYELLSKLNTNLGITILIVSHDIDAISQKAKTILCLNHDLVCHISSTEFRTGEYLSEVYGPHTHPIHHH
jgi:zinc transport system ATP-binding protein